MKNKSIFALFLLFIIIRAAHAESIASTKYYIEGFLAISKSKCAEVPEAIRRLEQEGKIAPAEAVKDSAYTMCECIPTKLRSMRMTLSAVDLNRKISESIFGSTVISPIVEQCGATQVRQTYLSDQCQFRSFAKNKKNPAQYCACMARNFASISDAEILQIGNDTAAYAPQAVEAQQRGLPPPPQPLSIQKIHSFDAACMVE